MVGGSSQTLVIQIPYQEVFGRLGKCDFETAIFGPVNETTWITTRFATDFE